jgi:hypothetical protein
MLQASVGGAVKDGDYGELLEYIGSLLKMYERIFCEEWLSLFILE